MEADLHTLPRFIRENSIFVMGNVYQGNSSGWEKAEQHITVLVNPASADGSHAFIYVDPDDMEQKRISVVRAGERVRLTGPALSTPSTAKVFLDEAPKWVSVNGRKLPPTFDPAEASLEIPIERNTPIDVEIGL